MKAMEISDANFEYFMIILHDENEGRLYWNCKGGFSSPHSLDFPLISKKQIKVEINNAENSQRKPPEVVKAKNIWLYHNPQTLT